MSAPSPSFAPSTWTRPLQIAIAICSVVFTIGTTLHNFVIINLPMMELTMRLGGLTAEEAAADAPGFLTGFRIVGVIFMIGNAAGILAWWRRPRWLFWLVLAVNVGQAAGVAMIPPEMFEAAVERYGWVGTLPSIITDGGAAILVIVLIVVLVRFRRPWALKPDPAVATVAARP